MTESEQPDLQDTKQAFISGATSGIGQALAQGFADAGYRVIGTGLGDLPNSEGGIRYANLDVRNAREIDAFLETIDQLDVLINTAGVIRREEELNPEIFDEVLDINLSGTMRLCANARALLSKTRGCIINTASMLSYFGGGLVPGYAASKGGVVQLTKSLAIAYASDGIRINAIAPGWIETSLTQELRDDPKRNQAILDRTPLGRWGDPSEIVGPALFLASPSASFITGTVLNVDGGYAAM